MTLDALQEELLTFAQAARRARPRGSKPAAPSSLWRWHTRGIAGIKLETICLGGTRYTSAEALQRFFDQVTAAKEAKLVIEEPRGLSGTRTPQSHQRLKEAGLL